ncbi:MAG: hypothetical protein OXI63_05710, partial [Candidatus Poribacteria bacterium]|nr:hypothetical protein [Candidatus Poribacteria bacterium]
SCHGLGVTHFMRSFTRKFKGIQTAAERHRFTENAFKISVIREIRDNPRFAAYSPKCDVHSDS